MGGARGRVLVVAVALVAALGLAACRPWRPSPPPGRVPILFNGEGNRLNAYETVPPFAKQTVIPSAADSPAGLDINAQICFFPDGSRRFIAGEDTGQPDPPPGWGIFRLDGRRVGSLRATEVAKLTPTYQGADPTSGENYGCGILRDGRVVTSDVGNQATGPENGQLIIWFPPFDTGVGGVGQVPYCKLDVGIGTAGQIFVDEHDRVYVASSRGSTSGLLRYTGPFPASADAAGGCGRTDATGAPLADAVAREQLFDPADGLGGANGIAPAPNGNLYVSNVVLGVITEVTRDGDPIRRLLEPPPGSGFLGYPTGTPFGLAVDRYGTLYYADLDLAIRNGSIGPGPDGKVWRIRFVRGEPQPPEIVDRGLRFPDGLGVLEWQWR